MSLMIEELDELPKSLQVLERGVILSGVTLTILLEQKAGKHCGEVGTLNRLLKFSTVVHHLEDQAEFSGD